MSRATWLADVLRSAGLKVVELDGWATRESRSGFDPQGVICHHTATPPSASNLSVRKLLRDGRSDLRGPLSQLGLERDGTFVLIAAGRCNHNGYGTWGNDSIGIEAYNDGVGERWPEAQLDAYRRGVRAICEHEGWGPGRVLGHKESDPGRKIDPANIDMDAFRRDAFAPEPPGDDDMTPEERQDLKECSMRVNRIAKALGLDDLKKPYPDELSDDMAARFDLLCKRLGIDRSGLKNNALARIDVTYDVTSRIDEIEAKVDRLISKLGA